MDGVPPTSGCIPICITVTKKLIHNITLHVFVSQRYNSTLSIYLYLCIGLGRFDDPEVVEQALPYPVEFWGYTDPHAWFLYKVQ